MFRVERGHLLQALSAAGAFAIISATAVACRAEQPQQLQHFEEVCLAHRANLELAKVESGRLGWHPVPTLPGTDERLVGAGSNPRVLSRVRNFAEGQALLILREENSLQPGTFTRDRTCAILANGLDYKSIVSALAARYGRPDASGPSSALWRSGARQPGGHPARGPGPGGLPAGGEIAVSQGKQGLRIAYTDSWGLDLGPGQTPLQVADAARRNGDFDLALSLMSVCGPSEISMCQVSIGWMYLEGDGVQEDPAIAAWYFSKSADSNDADGQFSLGFLYLNGRGVDRNVQKAVDLLTASANQGNASAQISLGVLYAEGRDVPSNPSLAARMFQSAANSKDPRGEFNLGMAYLEGVGLPKDVDQARYWISRAAAQGEPNAVRWLEDN